MYVYMYALTSLFMQADMHEYVGVYKYISMYAFIMNLWMHVCMY